MWQAGKVGEAGYLLEELASLLSFDPILASMAILLRVTAVFFQMTDNWHVPAATIVATASTQMAKVNADQRLVDTAPKPLNVLYCFQHVLHGIDAHSSLSDKHLSLYRYVPEPKAFLCQHCALRRTQTPYPACSHDGK